MRMVITRPPANHHRFTTPCSESGLRPCAGYGAVAPPPLPASASRGSLRARFPEGWGEPGSGAPAGVDEAVTPSAPARSAALTPSFSPAGVDGRAVTPSTPVWSEASTASFSPAGADERAVTSSAPARALASTASFSPAAVGVTGSVPARSEASGAPASASAGGRRSQVSSWWWAPLSASPRPDRTLNAERGVPASSSFVSSARTDSQLRLSIQRAPVFR